MNVNLSLGIVSFIVWSAFSIWYYVNFIKEFPEDESIVNRQVETPEATGESSAVALSRNIFFQLNSTNLVAPQAFNQFYDSLTKLKTGKIEVKIIGHACDLGTDAYNMDLSKARAEAMAKHLKDEQLTITDLSYRGESDPLVPNTSESNRKKNRRVHLQITMK